MLWCRQWPDAVAGRAGGLLLLLHPSGLTVQLAAHCAAQGARAAAGAAAEAAGNERSEDPLRTLPSAQPQLPCTCSCPMSAMPPLSPLATLFPTACPSTTTRWAGPGAPQRGVSTRACQQVVLRRSTTLCHPVFPACPARRIVHAAALHARCTRHPQRTPGQVTKP